MNEQQPERRPFQFSLAELLLWVAAVAVGLSAIRCLGVSAAVWIVPLGAYLFVWRLERRFTLPLFLTLLMALVVLFAWLFGVWGGV